MKITSQIDDEITRLKASATAQSSGLVLERLIVYDKGTQKEWLEIDRKSSEMYNWMFAAPFLPAGNTHYITVDLAGLAKGAITEPS